ncbi:MAG: CpsD/CapB family tyrosine-protein kinase [Sphingobium sp.]|nr:CpsD/CapB family tyrosine-protein kinase [Sphingobium sp.]
MFAPDAATGRKSFSIPERSELPVFTPNAAVLERNHIVGFNSRNLTSRPFSLLRSQLIKRMRTNGYKIVGITSPAPGAGKSFLSANIAASLSRLPSLKTLAFDLDVRRASLAANFGLTGKGGLEDFLAGGTDDLTKVGCSVAGTNLSLFPCFPNDLETVDLLASDRFAAFVKALKKLPDDTIVIFDMPPVFANDDAMVVATMIDAYLMVVEQGRTSARQITDSMRLLEPAKCIGSVLNRYEGGIGEGIGLGAYDKYSDYYRRDD